MIAAFVIYFTDSKLKQDYDANSKSTLLVLDNGAEGIAEGSEAFSMILDNNTSLQNHMELSGKYLYWQIVVKNTGNSGIVVEVGGDTHRVEAGRTARIYCTSQWYAGTYTFSFAGPLPDTMHGTAVCFLTDSADKIAE